MTVETETFKSTRCLLFYATMGALRNLKSNSRPSVLLRKMTMRDYDVVIRLWKQGNIPFRPQGRDSRKNIITQLRQPNCYFLVAEMNHAIVGTIVGTHDWRKGWINRLVVSPSYQRKGIARCLVEEVERYFTSQGIDIVASLIEDWNTTSMQVFEQLGYMKHPDILYFSKRKTKKV